MVLLDVGAPLDAGAPLTAAVNADRSSGDRYAGPPPTSAVRYRAPVPGPIVVVRRFEAPPLPYAAGHRGVDLAAPPEQVVLTAARGRVSFAGPVAGRGVVVIAHADGIRTEYEPLRPLVSAGSLVAAGQPIGLLRGQHDRCPPARCLHWGARRGGVYLDPMLLLRPLGPVRLLPWPPGARTAAVVGALPQAAVGALPLHAVGAARSGATTVGLGARATRFGGAGSRDGFACAGQPVVTRSWVSTQLAPPWGGRQPNPWPAVPVGRRASAPRISAAFYAQRGSGGQREAASWMLARYARGCARE
jgi:hypothetical protein